MIGERGGTGSPLSLSSLSQILALRGLGLVVVYTPYTFDLIARLPRGSGLVDAMARVVLVPGKSQVWSLALWVEGGRFLLTGLFREMSVVGILGPIGSDVLSPICFIGGVLALLVVQWIRLRPAPLTERQPNEARASVPLVFDRDALAPCTLYLSVSDAGEGPGSLERP